MNRAIPLILVFFLAGCASPQPDAGGREQAPWAAFDSVAALNLVSTTWIADYESQDARTMRISLGEPRPTLTPDGTKVRLAPLRIEYGSSVPPTIHWMDAGLRIVRMDYPCGGYHPSDGECTGPRVEWLRAGVLPPHGVGWPALQLPNGTLPIHLGNKTTLIEVDQQKEAGTMRLTPTPEWLAEFLRREHTAWAAYNGALVPSVLQVSETQWSLKSFTRGASIDPPEYWIPTVSSVAAAGPLPPGSDQDVLGGGTSISDALDRLRLDEATARKQLATGCIGGVEQVLQIPADAGIGAPVWGSGATVKTIFHVDSPDGWVAWQVLHYADPHPLQDEWQYSSEESDLPRECYGSRDPSHDVSLERVMELVQIVAPEVPVPDLFILPNPEVKPAWAEPFGDFYSPHHIIAGIAPRDSGLTLLPPHVGVARETGTLRVAMLTPDQYDSL